ncbi:MAG TPA: hypothetical protein VKR57_13655 [Terriglobales bacterium]|nr:hypothetical protein [Terriglobales bacterium]
MTVGRACHGKRSGEIGPIYPRSIDAATAPLPVLAGANVLVAGSSSFAEAGGVTAVMERLRTAINLGSEVTVTV